MISFNVLKRGIDITVSLSVILFLLSWIIPLIGLLIIIDSRGPIFFIQSRDGKNKKPFNCLKFRTMRPTWTAHLIQSRENDDRITRIGTFLRKSHLDELPQFINIFKGEMSLIGPRPHMHRDTNYYGKLVEKYDERLNVKPGFTGLAQINDLCGNTNNVIEMAHRVRLDRFYVSHMSMKMELLIVYRSFVVAFRKCSSFIKHPHAAKTPFYLQRRLQRQALKKVA